MNRIIDGLKYWAFPKTNAEAAREIDMLNIVNIHYTSTVLCAVQTISLLIYTIVNFAHLGEGNTATSLFTVGMSIVLTLAASIVTGKFRRAQDGNRHSHLAVNLLTGMYFSVLIIWGMIVSAMHYLRGEQIVTFYVVVIIAVLFVKLRPLLSATMILASFTVYYIWLEFFLVPGKINLYNFMMLGAITAAGSVINYRLTLNHILQKNRAEKLNETLEMIASHDSITGLYNRHALNKRIVTFLGKPLCVAMGDIDRFKQINDTYGHHMGDKVLKRFAWIITRRFPKEAVFRYGGDEFLVVYESADIEDFRAKLDEVNREFGALRENGIEMGTGCSFGCVTDTPKNTAAFFNMILTADKKLYEKKHRKHRKASE